MSEKLTIKNFGPIVSVNLDIKQFNVLIGENATGKSTIAKVLAICRYFSYIALNPKVTFSTTSSSFFQGLASWGILNFLKENTCINYECDDYNFDLKKNKAKINNVNKNGDVLSSKTGEIWAISLDAKSQRFKKLLEELTKIQFNKQNEINESDNARTIPTSFYQNDVASVLDNPFYLPTERGLQSIFSLGKNSIQNISDSLFNQFAKLDLVARNFIGETLIEPFEITYKYENGKGFVKKNGDETFYSLTSGASGYKSAIPIILAMKYYEEIRKKKKTFIIEEPELNLFPTAQNLLMKFTADKISNTENQVFINTHSPYILTSLNNLIYSHQVGKNHEEEVNKIIEKQYWIDSKDVSVYMLLDDGTGEDILDKEEGLIKAEKIDSVTNILNEQFEALLNLDLLLK